jgi:hypothetical protein
VRQLSDFVVAGSTGQPKVHPLLEEVRRHRLLLERLTSALNLPDDDQEVGDRGSTRHARRAAEGRWRRKVPSTENGKLAELRAGFGSGDASQTASREDTRLRGMPG